MEGGWKAGARKTGRVSRGSLHPDGRTWGGGAEVTDGGRGDGHYGGRVSDTGGWRWEMSGDDQLDKKTTYTENTEGGAISRGQIRKQATKHWPYSLTVDARVICAISFYL